jgi:hypothetical protein
MLWQPSRTYCQNMVASVKKSLKMWRLWHIFTQIILHTHCIEMTRKDILAAHSKEA